jgi:hypothetical protein
MVKLISKKVWLMLSWLAPAFAANSGPVGSARFAAAGGAAAQEVNVIILDLKFAGIYFRPRQVVEARVFHVNYASAIQTDQVVMLLELGIETRGRSRVAGLGHEAEGNEGAQDAMNGHAGNLRQLAAHLAVQLLSRRMVGPVHDGFINGAALGRDRQATFPVGGEKAVDSFFFVGRGHRSEMNI